MEYGRLLRAAWSLTWRHKFLWLLGMFTPASVGSCSFRNSAFQIPRLPDSSDGLPSLRPEFDDLGPAASQVTSWIDRNGALLVALIGAVVVLLVLILVISYFAQAAMIRSSGDLGVGLRSTLRTSLKSGFPYFWRLLGLSVLTAVVAVLLAIGLAAAVAMGVAIAAVGGPVVTAIVIIAGVLVAIPLGLIALVGTISISVALGFARRAIVIDDDGLFVGIRRGFALFREHLAPSLVSWLVAVGVSIGVAIVGFLLAATVIAILALPAIVAVALSSFSTPVLVYVIVAATILFILMWVFGGAMNALLWSYWTLVYLRLTGRSSVGFGDASAAPPSGPVDPAPPATAGA